MDTDKPTTDEAPPSIEYTPVLNLITLKELKRAPKFDLKKYILDLVDVYSARIMLKVRDESFLRQIDANIRRDLRAHKLVSRTQIIYIPSYDNFFRALNPQYSKWSPLNTYGFDETIDFFGTLFGYYKPVSVMPSQYPSLEQMLYVVNEIITKQNRTSVEKLEYCPLECRSDNHYTEGGYVFNTKFQDLEDKQPLTIIVLLHTTKIHSELKNFFDFKFELEYGDRWNELNFAVYFDKV